VREVYAILLKLDWSYNVVGNFMFAVNILGGIHRIGYVRRTAQTIDKRTVDALSRHTMEILDGLKIQVETYPKTLLKTLVLHWASA
jgi:hypothetical protein